MKNHVLNDSLKSCLKMSITYLNDTTDTTDNITDVNVISKYFYSCKSINRIKMSKKSLYSTALLADGELTAKLIAKCVGYNKTIADMCSNCGGNTQWFAYYFKHVIAIEKDPNEFARVVNNMNIYGYKNITFHNDSCLNVDIQNADVVFYDPEWGGSDYKKIEKLELRLDDKNILDIINGINGNTGTNKLIVLKHPYNAIIPDGGKTIIFKKRNRFGEKEFYRLTFYNVDSTILQDVYYLK